jgi:hypothetical protein
MYGYVQPPGVTIRRIRMIRWSKEMSDNSPFLILKQPCDAAIDWVSRQISCAGLQVVRTFDLLDARHDHASCPCPNHGTGQCDCQMVVLLVYGTGGNKLSGHQPVSIVAHGNNGITWFSVVDTPQQRADSRLEAAIRLALDPHVEGMLLNESSESHGV